MEKLTESRLRKLAGLPLNEADNGHAKAYELIGKISYDIAKNLDRVKSLKAIAQDENFLVANVSVKELDALIKNLESAEKNIDKFDKLIRTK